MGQTDPTALSPGSELKARERVDRFGVWLDSAHVAQGDLGAALLEQCTDTLAEASQVGTFGRAGRGHRQ
jgi:hypothetical protein